MELLLTVAVFGLFISLVLIGVAGRQAARRDVTRVANMDQLQKALAMYVSDAQEYPEMKGCVTGDDPLMLALKEKKFFDDKAVLRDPKTPDDAGGCFYYDGGGSAYSLRYVLETDAVDSKGEHFLAP
jgi:type II secretory pathway pseudopilin PulG